jgi:UPF0271 protein
MDRTINLNADMGESFGRYRIGNDAALIRVVKSANVACGFHAGDPNVMAEAARLAQAHGVSVGAHPSFHDLQGFGRRVMHVAPREVENLVAYQIGALQGIAAGCGTRVTHVKPHGSLNNMAHTDRAYADAIAAAIRSVDSSLVFVANALSQMVEAGHEAGLRVAEEAYADRTYEDDGQMTSRLRPNAMITDPDAAARQVVTFLNAGGIVTRSGHVLPTPLRTFCAHGDEPSGAAVMQAVHDTLMAEGWNIVPLTGLSY